jgi:hypothetical protein
MVCPLPLQANIMEVEFEKCARGNLSSGHHGEETGPVETTSMFVRLAAECPERGEGTPLTRIILITCLPGQNLLNIFRTIWPFSS